MRTLLARGAAALLAAAPLWALAGAQQYEELSASVRASLARAVTDRDSVRSEDPETVAWVRAMHPRVAGRMRDDDAARELLALVHYEARRAGLEPRLVLAVIDVESGFRKYAVSSAGARGYMQVMPFWVREIGMPGQSLFHPRTNLRYGCVILRHYLDIERGNLVNALGRYNGSLGKPGYPERVLGALRSRWTPGA
ncbi:MAG: transglycosylase SLT domain-containing protein [Burkholderiales bacterium]|nr:transglycosylase SLT domain-containing protein [Burkholderiales bacterium]MBX3716194.1 transglycosylase SLT domain-containing protein [Burkholderiales bacterium]